ncbi:uncharacterized protein LOC8078742 [Sorghum bicolor]|jgi:hypothetical protein|uniref:Uncharacterized protein n=1 Tax=Sorghum bicolor TaxID=4558 RepID=C5XM11_SORBI|nr:uncharacterized protein LOC8078742 [Sorghum bicolor]EES02329.1 hypothetical protein SORBI_3003G037100 [Sorghum bicolor]|eukprot:XP_002457209.1 uncharacterized protein LOC8078742 [Sorghum bicolor]
MDFSNMILRPALHRITSSFASTTNSSYGGFITRLLSFTGSFNDRTSLLHEHDAEQEAAAPPPPQAPESAPAAPFDIEAGTTTTLLAPTGTAPEGPAAEGQEEPAATELVDAESRRVGKSVQTVCLFVASASLVLFANLPSNKQQTGPAAAPPAASAGQHPLLYSADMAFISLGFFSSLGLSMFSIVARPGQAAVARVQKWGMVVAVASVVVAFSLRVCMMPAA